MKLSKWYTFPTKHGISPLRYSMGTVQNISAQNTCRFWKFGWSPHSFGQQNLAHTPVGVVKMVLVMTTGRIAPYFDLKRSHLKKMEEITRDDHFVCEMGLVVVWVLFYNFRKTLDRGRKISPDRVSFPYFRKKEIHMRGWAPTGFSSERPFALIRVNWEQNLTNCAHLESFS